jgi:hypothetical protein
MVDVQRMGTVVLMQMVREERRRFELEEAETPIWDGEAM